MFSLMQRNNLAKISPKITQKTVNNTDAFKPFSCCASETVILPSVSEIFVTTLYHPERTFYQLKCQDKLLFIKWILCDSRPDGPRIHGESLLSAIFSKLNAHQSMEPLTAFFIHLQAFYRSQLDAFRSTCVSISQEYLTVPLHL